VRKALTGLGRDPRRARTTIKAGPVYDLDQLIVQAEQVTSRLSDLEGRLCPHYPSIESTSSSVKFPSFHEWDQPLMDSEEFCRQTGPV
jgi:hypothetical protein